ncbi:ShlB/FhaC/HecB family hemolysin secretion/activation protein [Tardiphaga alba]|uniref:ShlB/FhaC/HecB family hemolysin secretion/activation protein n=1 Tax=Tardiphaga alba TaxID=340268 RepID=A0ABX8A6X8_9BRAD|nr:ShlB/FhaC/HecB family hemolysin secretion/activation protein [Tardiphaga alba]QUS38449.1 ShlB/FhaC/HecB family hemolysin secretion/activation protein [Tardiphaga alba]
MLSILRDDTGAAVPKRRLLQSSAPAALILASIGACGSLSSADAAPSKQVAENSSQDAKVAAKPNADSAQAPAAPAEPLQRFDIDDFAVQGADKLPQIDIEEAIYPFLGPSRTADDVEKARAALEKAYHDKGLQTVSVSVPQQNALTGRVILKVTEMKVGQLRVKNSRYFDLDKIKDRAPSLKQGVVPNFNDVTKDIVGLNQWPDRRVTPALRAGIAPGTVDVDLNVEDKAPFHGSIELNNRRSPNTTASRLIGTVRYDNLWQRGHSFSFTYQVAPENPNDAEVFSASYMARLEDVDWLNVLVYGVKSSSDVATVGGMNVVGPGQIIGARAVMTLPARENFFHTFSVGADYKHFDQTMRDLSGNGYGTPITYVPVVASYGATFQGEKSLTQLNASVTAAMRPAGDDWRRFDDKRAYASGSFSHLNVDLAHTHELPEGFQFWAKVQGQISDGPQVSSEQFSIGGLDTVRGYLESEVLGDDGVVGNVEIRSPDVGSMLQKEMKDETGEGAPRFTTFNEWRFFGFVDGGHVRVQRPLTEQQSTFDVWSYGAGTRFKFFEGVNGMVAYSVPMVSQAYTHAGTGRVNFRIWGEF